jgi:hypothetical protein
MLHRTLLQDKAPQTTRNLVCHQTMRILLSYNLLSLSAHTTEKEAGHTTEKKAGHTTAKGPAHTTEKGSAHTTEEHKSSKIVK